MEIIKRHKTRVLWHTVDCEGRDRYLYHFQPGNGAAPEPTSNPSSWPTSKAGAKREWDEAERLRERYKDSKF